MSVLGDDILGFVTVKYESGNLGPGAVSSGRGDPGGKSYGLYQLASRTGSLRAYIKSSLFKADLQKHRPTSSAFDRKWKFIAQRSPTMFALDQHAFIKRTHYDKVRRYADAIRIPNTRAINEAIFSISVQHGGAKIILRRAGIKPIMGERTVVNRLYDARIGYVRGLSSLSASIRRAILNRYKRERSDVLRLVGSRSVGPVPTRGRDKDVRPEETSEKKKQSKAPFVMMIIFAIIVAVINLLGK